MKNDSSQPETVYYRALHDYVPSAEDQANGYLVISRDDLLEVTCPIDLDGEGTIEKPTGWLLGKNRRTKLEGYFPSGEYVSFVPKPQPVVRPRVSRPPRPSSSHQTVVVYFVKPVLCRCCNDFIWGTGEVGKMCKGCGVYLHNDCESLLVTKLGPCAMSSSVTLPSLHSPSRVPVEQWDVDTVIEWLAVVNLYRYANMFRQHHIDGSILTTLDVNRLRGMQISDEFHQKAIMAAVDILRGTVEVCDVSQVNGTGCDDLAEPLHGNAALDDHSLIETSFSALQKCHVCCQLMLGILRQGYQCLDCGLCCHRRCLIAKLPVCDAEQVKKYGQLSFPANEMFRQPLSAQFTVSRDTPAPPLVMHCVAFLDNASDTNGIRVLDEYRKSCPTEEIDRLKCAVCNVSDDDMMSVISGSKPSCVAGLLKRYLRELPDSVIPQHSYVDFINAAKLAGDAACEGVLHDLVNSLPDAHLSTLRHIIIHLRRACWPTGRTTHGAASVSGRNRARLITEVFNEILLRPLWTDITDLVHNTDYHLRVISTLIVSNIWSEQMVPPPVRQAPLPPVDESKTAHLEDAPWYWGSITREEVNHLMSGSRDGTFLVRDATDKTPNFYTLTIRKGGSNRLVKIEYGDGHYGFAKPFKFSSVTELIDYYCSHSLLEHNPGLDVVLTQPVSRFSRPGSKIQPLDNLRQQYLTAHTKHVLCSEELDLVSDRHSQTMQSIQLKQQALEAFRETISLFDEQMKICEKNLSVVVVDPLENQKVCENMELLRQRAQMIRMSQESLEQELNTDLELSRKLLADMNALKPELKQLIQNRDSLRKQLLECGENASSLDSLLKNHDPVQTVTVADSCVPLVPQEYFQDERNWLVNCNRPEAERLLRGREEGTFLIRPKDGDTYVLSIVKPHNGANGEEVSPTALAGGIGPIAHCLIKQQDTGFFGFAEPYFIHPTLKDLVLHYREESLFEHNDELDTCLRIPVKLNAQQLTSLPIVTMEQADSSQNYVQCNFSRPR